MTKEEIGYAVERIEHLERIFDEVKESFISDKNFFENKKMQVKVSLLTQYLNAKCLNISSTLWCKGLNLG